MLPVSRIACSIETISPSLAAIACQEMRKSPALLVRVSERGCVRRMGERQVQRVAEAAAFRAGEMLSGRAGHPDEARLGKPRRVGVVAERRWLERAVTAIPTTVKDGPTARSGPPLPSPGPPAGPGRWPSTRPVPAADKVVEADAVADREAEEVGQAALDDHAAVGDPVAGGELGLVDRCTGGIPPLGHHRIGVPVDHQVRRRDQVRPAGVDDTGSC